MTITSVVSKLTLKTRDTILKVGNENKIWVRVQRRSKGSDVKVEGATEKIERLD